MRAGPGAALDQRRKWRPVSASLGWKDNDLAGINTVGIPNLPSVGLVKHGVTLAVPVSQSTDAPETVAAGYDLGRRLGSGGGGRRVFACRRGGASLRSSGRLIRHRAGC